MVCWVGTWGRGDGKSIPYEPPTRPRTLPKVFCGWWVVVGSEWWGSKGILEFCFGPNLGLILEAGTKLNNYSQLVHIFPIFDQIKDKISILGPFYSHFLLF